MISLYSDEDIAHRDRLRTFFRTAIPQDIRDKVSAGKPVLRDDMIKTQRLLNAEGLAVPHWPKEWGGRGWSPTQMYIYQDELQRNCVPIPLAFNCAMIGPVLINFASDALKERFLARAANLDDWWCQGFSEPGAGSDLASLKTRATRTDDGWIVSGQKAWTTYGQYADWMFCLVRTDPDAKKQSGISMLLIDMKSEGVSVRPVITMDGRHEVNEVFLDNVHVPAENLVGVENDGWSYAKFLLANERSGIARIGATKERVARIRRLAKATPATGGSLWDSPSFRQRVIALETEVKALEFVQMGILARASDKGGAPDPASSILKLKGTQLQQEASLLLMEIGGAEALSPPVNVADPHALMPPEADHAVALANYTNLRKVSIYGGTDEIQREIIAKTILNL